MDKLETYLVKNQWIEKVKKLRLTYSTFEPKHVKFPNMTLFCYLQRKKVNQTFPSLYSNRILICCHFQAAREKTQPSRREKCTSLLSGFLHPWLRSQTISLGERELDYTNSPVSLWKDLAGPFSLATSHTYKPESEGRTSRITNTQYTPSARATKTH